jgi:hypothetical protein
MEGNPSERKHMSTDDTSAAMIDLDDAAAILGIPLEFARTYLDSREEPPVATYHGKPLWLSDSVHDLLAGEAAA